MNKPKFKIGDRVARDLEIENSNPFTGADTFQILEIQGTCSLGEKWTYKYIARPLRDATVVVSFFESEIVTDKERHLREKMLSDLQEKHSYDSNIKEVYTPPLTRGTAAVPDYKIGSISNNGDNLKNW